MDSNEKYVEVPTTFVIETGALPNDNWVAIPSKDSWLVPREEYEKVFGKVN
jgi:hypothetical protein